MGGIFLIQDGGALVEMTETAYDSEALLQELLARYPSLLAGDQIDSGAPRRWLLISREVPLASEEGGAGRWSIDHIFLDQDAVPTLVEVKRSSDTRIRREVVGQMLDYAANAVVYWPVEQMQARFEQRCALESRDPAEVFVESFGPEVDPDAFWEQAKVNLQAGKVRMVFLADQIPSELLRIVEFLNTQMDPAQVLAVEVRQVVGQGQRAMVPRVLGQTAKAQQEKSASRFPGRQWDETTFFQALEAHSEPRTVATARRILQWAKDRNLNIFWGGGRVTGTFYPYVEFMGKGYSVIGVRTDGKFEISMYRMPDRPPFDDPAKRQEFWRRFHQIGSVNVPPDRYDTWSIQPLSAVSSDVERERLLEFLDWFFGEVRGSAVPS